MTRDDEAITDDAHTDERDAELAVARVRDMLGWSNERLDPAAGPVKGEQQGRRFRAGQPGPEVQVHRNRPVRGRPGEASLPVMMQPRRQQLVEQGVDDRIGHAPQRLSDEAKELAHGRNGRISDVVNVSGNEQNVCLVLLKRVEQPGEKRIMLRFARMAHQFVAKMPIGGVQQLYGLGHAQDSISLG